MDNSRARRQWAVRVRTAVLLAVVMVIAAPGKQASAQLLRRLLGGDDGVFVRPADGSTRGKVLKLGRVTRFTSDGAARPLAEARRGGQSIALHCKAHGHRPAAGHATPSRNHLAEPRRAW